jgi:hypothetical protein
MNIQTETKVSNGNTVTDFCVSCGRKLIAQIQNTKKELALRFRKSFYGNERMLRLVLNEAEALAFSTDYPQLLFPSLALEKVESAASWQRHQLEVSAK